MKVYSKRKTIEETCYDLSKRFGITQEQVNPIVQKIAEVDGPMETYLGFLESALSYSTEKTLQIFGSTTNMEMLLLNLSIGGSFHNFCPMLYDLKELSASIEEALHQLGQNRTMLVGTGLSKFYSGRCTPLDVLASRLYFVKIPVGIKASNSKNGYEVSFAWKCSERIIMKPDSLPPYHISRFIGSDFVFTPDPETDHEIVFDPDYFNGSVIKDLQEKADWIESLRAKIHSLKIEVLQIVLDALKIKDQKSLLPKCIAAIARVFNREEIESLLKLDALYAKHHLYSGRTLTSMTSQKFNAQNGGISEILWLIGHCEFEIQTRFISDIRNGLGKLVISHPVLGNQLVPIKRSGIEGNGDGDGIDHWLKSFIDASTEDREKIETAFRIFWSESDMVVEFWQEFSRRIELALESDFIGPVHIKALGKHKNLLQAYAQQLVESQKLGLAIKDLNPVAKNDNSSKFPFVDGTNWEDIRIEFDSAESLIISAKGVRKKYTFAEIGFKNDNTQKPQLLWYILMDLALLKGTVNFPDDLVPDAVRV